MRGKSRGLVSSLVYWAETDGLYSGCLGGVSMLKGAVAVLIGILAIVTWELREKVASNRQMVEQIQELHRSLENKSAREAFELQEKCTLQAKSKFQSIPNAYGGHRGHYNAMMNKCL